MLINKFNKNKKNKSRSVSSNMSIQATLFVYPFANKWIILIENSAYQN